MKNLALGVLSAVALGAVLTGTAAPARATGYGYDDYDGSTTVITRRTIIERRVVRPRPVVQEVAIERPVNYRPRPIVREVVVERPVVYRRRPAIKEEFVERDGFYGLERDEAYRQRSFRHGPGRFGYGGPGYDAYD